jgi:hypothetical protein
VVSFTRLPLYAQGKRSWYLIGLEVRWAPKSLSTLLTREKCSSAGNRTVAVLIHNPIAVRHILSLPIGSLTEPKAVATYPHIACSSHSQPRHEYITSLTGNYDPLDLLILLSPKEIAFCLRLVLMCSHCLIRERSFFLHYPMQNFQAHNEIRIGYLQNNLTLLLCESLKSLQLQ